MSTANFCAIRLAFKCDSESGNLLNLIINIKCSKSVFEENEMVIQERSLRGIESSCGGK